MPPRVRRVPRHLRLPLACLPGLPGTMDTCRNPRPSLSGQASPSTVTSPHQLWVCRETSRDSPRFRPKTGQAVGCQGKADKQMYGETLIYTPFPKDVDSDLRVALTAYFWCGSVFQKVPANRNLPSSWVAHPHPKPAHDCVHPGDPLRLAGLAPGATAGVGSQGLGSSSPLADPRARCEAPWQTAHLLQHPYLAQRRKLRPGST